MTTSSFMLHGVFFLLEELASTMRAPLIGLFLRDTDFWLSLEFELIDTGLDFLENKLNN